MRFSCMTQSMSASFYRYRLVHVMHIICTFSLTTRMHSSRMCTAHSSSHPGGVCLSACWETPPPPVWAWRTPLGVGLETPLARPLNFPLDVGLETCKECWDTPSPPPGPAARHAGIPPAMHAGIPPGKKNRHM